jgi:hypothetical protein
MQEKLARKLSNCNMAKQNKRNARNYDVLGGIRRALAENVPVIGRLEDYRGFAVLDFVGINYVKGDRNTPGVVYEAVMENSSEFRRLKSSLIEAGVFPRSADARTSKPVLNVKYLEIFLDEPPLKVNVRVKRAHLQFP